MRYILSMYPRHPQLFHPSNPTPQFSAKTPASNLDNSFEPLGTPSTKISIISPLNTYGSDSFNIKKISLSSKLRISLGCMRRPEQGLACQPSQFIPNRILKTKPSHINCIFILDYFPIFFV